MGIISVFSTISHYVFCISWWKLFNFYLETFLQRIFLYAFLKNLQTAVTPSILMLETSNTHHSNPLDEAILMIPKVLKSDHWVSKSIKIYLNLQTAVTPSILMLETSNTHHSIPLDEMILMMPNVLKSNHWMPR